MTQRDADKRQTVLENDVYRASENTHEGYGMPRGPITIPPINPPPLAIGFCPLCGTNARETCSNRGMFDCPECYYWWYDERVGKQSRPRNIDEFFSKE